MRVKTESFPPLREAKTQHQVRHDDISRIWGLLAPKRGDNRVHRRVVLAGEIGPSTIVRRHPIRDHCRITTVVRGALVFYRGPLRMMATVKDICVERIARLSWCIRDLVNRVARPDFRRWLTKRTTLRTALRTIEKAIVPGARLSRDYVRRRGIGGGMLRYRCVACAIRKAI